MDDMTDKAIKWVAPAEGADAGQAVLHVLRAGCDACARTTCPTTGRTSTEGKFDDGWDALARADLRPPEAARRNNRRTPSSPNATPEIPAWDEIPARR